MHASRDTVLVKTSAFNFKRSMIKILTKHVIIFVKLATSTDFLRFFDIIHLSFMTSYTVKHCAFILLVQSNSINNY
jgi:hypothetical protein